MINFRYTFSILLFIGILASCSKNDQTIIDESAVDAPTLAVDTTELLLSIDDRDEDAMTFNWNDVKLNVNTPIEYELKIDTSGGDFSDASVLQKSSDTTYEISVGDLNEQVKSLGIPEDTEGEIVAQVNATIGKEGLDLNSNILDFSVTTYSGTVDNSADWGVVGDATPNGWDGPDVPFTKTDEDNVFVTYIELDDGEIKFRKNNDFGAGDFGGADGTLVEGGDNIEVSEGRFKITIDLDALTYEMKEHSMGIVGDATPNGWDGPDVPMEFDPETNTFHKTVELDDGEIKFRLNNEFNDEWGGSDGELIPGGDNIPVDAGKYEITIDILNGTYELSAIED